ncbi:AAA family ATPase [Candidatus Woesearchaeota archaeon]|nr:AAA family ATPase [Candidatus Woesearchaeota archaeon]
MILGLVRGANVIIGITGMYSSGKDTVADYFVREGFTHFSLSDLIRDELGRRGMEVTRENLIRVANEMRTEYGHGVLGERALEKMKGKDGDFVISSIRHPGEVKALKKHGHFFLVEVRAPIRTRFTRIKKRNREKDPKTLSELKANEKRECQKSGPGQQLTNVIKMANCIVVNDSTVNKAHIKAEKLLKDLRKKAAKLPTYVRPTWDEYFMGIVDAVSKRATCDRGRTAVVIVKNKRMLATGYVGSPMGLPHCDNVGHKMKKIIHEDGRISQHCVRTNHAEINAVALAARNGVSIDGATLYCKLAPCYTCAKMIINAGIRRIVCQKRYHGDTESWAMFKQAGVKFSVIDDTVEQYANQ